MLATRVFSDRCLDQQAALDILQRDSICESSGITNYPVHRKVYHSFFLFSTNSVVFVRSQKGLIVKVIRVLVEIRRWPMF